MKKFRRLSFSKKKKQPQNSAEGDERLSNDKTASSNTQKRTDVSFRKRFFGKSHRHKSSTPNDQENESSQLQTEMTGVNQDERTRRVNAPSVKHEKLSNGGPGSEVGRTENNDTLKSASPGTSKQGASNGGLETGDYSQSRRPYRESEAAHESIENFAAKSAHAILNSAVGSRVSGNGTRPPKLSVNVNLAANAHDGPIISLGPTSPDIVPNELDSLTSNYFFGRIERQTMTEEFRRLAQQGWYWGPLSKNEAEQKLNNTPDGSFLVRDSSDERYLLSLSFRSQGRTLHTRIEHSNGRFSFYENNVAPSYTSVVALINDSIRDSQTEGVFCYSRSRDPHSFAYPVKLVYPVSRFTQVRSLQYLCRFLIRQYTRIDHIEILPLPWPVKGYLNQSYY